MRGALAIWALLGAGDLLAQGSSCVTKKSEPATYQGLLACQKKKRAALDAAYEKKTGEGAPESAVDKLDSLQRAEIQNYLAHHPDRAPTYESSAAGPGEDGARPISSPKARNAAGDPDLDALSADLQKKSDGGKKGVTPEMAGEVRAMLKSKQGSVSPDMDSFLNSVQKDGTNLTPQTVDKLKEAARAAKAGGMDLPANDPATKYLLETGKEVQNQ